MSKHNQLPTPIRNIRARLRYLMQPMVWGSVLFLSLFTIISWELWSNPEDFLDAENITESDLLNIDSELPFLNGVSPETVDIDNSQVLREKINSLQTPPPNIPTPQVKLKNSSQKASQTQQKNPNPAQQNSTDFSNIFLSGTNLDTQNSSQLFDWGQPSQSVNFNSYLNSYAGKKPVANTPNSQNTASLNPFPSTLPSNTLIGNNGGLNSPLEAVMQQYNPGNLSSNLGRSQTGEIRRENQNSPEQSDPSPADSENSSKLPSSSMPIESTDRQNSLRNQTESQNFSPYSLSEIQQYYNPYYNPSVSTENINPSSTTTPSNTNNLSMPIAPTTPTNSYTYLRQSQNLNIDTTPITPTAPPLRGGSTVRSNPTQSPLRTNRTQSNLETLNQPSGSTSNQPSVQSSAPTSVGAPSGSSLPSFNPFSPTTTQNPDQGLQNLGVQTPQTTQPFSVPRPIPGRYIGGGQINTFSNP